MFVIMGKIAGYARLTAFACLSAVLFAQSPAGSLQGVVTDSAGNPISGLSVSSGKIEVVTDDLGRYKLKGLSKGDCEIVLTYFGRELARESITIAHEMKERNFQLTIDPHIAQGLVVTATRTGEQDNAIMTEQVIRRIPAPVTGELLRHLPGVDSVRRGPVGLDPVVQGLRETQVGQYFDGARIFPAGPARMDSGLSHIDPGAINRIQVVKGPYALTWGAGNLSAIKVESFDLNRITQNGLGGSLLAGYHSNTEAQQLSGSVFGKQGPASYWFYGVGREGSDYETGDGVEIPGDMTSREIRGKMRYELGNRSRITVQAGYQEQEDLDYPGRILDALFFKTHNFSVKYELQDLSDLVQNLTASIYFNTVAHDMNNDQKPTAQPNPNRIPPFPIKVYVNSESDVLGGQFSMDLFPSGNMELKLGADFYHSEKDATRFISRRDTGMLMFEDKMWPEAQLTDVGLYGRASWPFGDVLSGEATIRVDLVEASAGEISEFFRENISNDTDSSETNLSGAMTLNAALNGNWSLSLGLGSAVRTADPNERFSDRIPTARAQISAEFVGDPSLKPERSNQADLWLDGQFSRISLHLNGFYRRIEDYITLVPTQLPKRLPLSPPTVFRYANGEAEFKGADVSMAARLTNDFDLRLSTGWLEGEDLDLNEPAYGVAPWSSSLELNYSSQNKKWFAQGLVRDISKQDKVSPTRNEAITSGYTTLDMTAGFNFRNQVTLQLGAVNLTDESYTNHLNARNPYTGAKIPEPGRTLHFTVRYAF